MVASWASEEMKTANLRDKRLNRRLMEVLSQLASRPTASIPAACGGRAEMAAAYRLFANEKAGFDKLLEPHVESTHERIAAEPVVVLAQDTTEVELTRPQQQVVGAGPLDGGARRGALLHALHAFTPDGTPLGTVTATVWARDERSGASQASRAQRAAVPAEQKESRRWAATWETAVRCASRRPATRVIVVADSEADVYEHLVAATSEPRTCDWIIRAAQDRALLGASGEQPAENRLWAHVLKQPALFRHTISVRGRRTKISCEKRARRQERQSRQAEVEVRAAQVVLRPPRRPLRQLPPATAGAVLVREINPPAGEEPVQWLLLTSLPIEGADQARQVIQYYCVRWMIEVFFRVLKSGCRVEERQFERLDRLLACLAVYLVVAWRTLYVCRLGRGCPDVSCEAIFEPAEWKSVWKIVKRQDPPGDPPSLGVMVRLVAQLGGYVHPSPDRPPGPQTLWIGLQRTHDFALCWEMFGPEVKQQTPTYV
jgi:hypothetical protein